MKFFFIVLSISCYIISQTTINARPTGVRKISWFLPTNGNYLGDFYREKFDLKRQAGWGKRHDESMENEYDDLQPYHSYASQDNLIHSWLDDT